MKFLDASPMKINKYLLIVLSGFILSTSFVSAENNDTLQVIDPWIREAPPNMPALGGFLRLKNTGDQAIVIVGSSSPFFEMVEIHRTVIQDGTARMIRQEKIEILPGREAVFEPGGLHLMMMRPTGKIKKGDQVDVNIELENGAVIEFGAAVKSGRM